MAGIPPLVGFFAKAEVLYSAISNGYYFISIIAILVSVISASYYLKIIKVLHISPSASDKSSLFPSFLRSEAKDFEGLTSKSEVKAVSSSHSFMISTLTLFILFFILKPSILLNSTQLLALSLFYF